MSADSDTSVSMQLARIERDARADRLSRADTLWLICELRRRTAELVSIDAEVRAICAQIDVVLEKAVTA